MRPEPLASWAKARLVAGGVMDRQTGATRTARARYCERCRAHIFRGLDADWGSLSRDIDPHPLTRLGEVAVLLAGRRTFTLRFLYSQFVIDPRNRFVIAAEPAGSVPGADVVVQHDCGLVGQLGKAHLEPVVRRRRVRTVPLPDDPPF